MADFLSRKYNDEKKFTHKLPNECDMERCHMLDKKLKKDMSYTAAKTMYVIYSFIKEPEESLLDMKMEVMASMILEKFSMSQRVQILL